MVLTAVVGWLLQGVAFAHKFGGPNDPCERKIGKSLIHITLYQPEFNPDAEYCDQIPRAGNTVLVVDVLGNDLRKLPLGVQILAVSDSAPNKAVLALPPTIYRRGVADAQVVLDDNSSYLTQISLGEGAEQQLLSFPVRVSAWYRPFIMPALIVLAVFALMTISILRYYWLSADDAHSEPMLELVEGKPRPLTLLPRPERRASGTKLRSSIVIFIFASCILSLSACHFFFQAEDGIRDWTM